MHNHETHFDNRHMLWRDSMTKPKRTHGTSSRSTSPIAPDKTVFKSFGQCSFAGNSEPSMVDVKNGKILRIRPIHYDKYYAKKDLNFWKISKNGKTFELLMKSAQPAYHFAYKKRVYSPNRIQYPLKRVDWDPNGERNTQNRGKKQIQTHQLGRGHRPHRLGNQAHPIHLRQERRAVPRRRPWRD